MFLAMTMFQGLLAWLMIIVCCFLMFVVLIQRGRGGGLAGAFGGAGGSGAFGTKTGDVFTWITVALASFMFVLAVIGNYAFYQDAPRLTRSSAVGQLEAPVELEEGAVPPTDEDGASESGDTGGAQPAGAEGQPETVTTPTSILPLDDFAPTENEPEPDDTDEPSGNDG